MSNYYNPPEEIKRIGRKLWPGSFSSLMRQVELDEILIGVYMNRNLIDIASHINAEERLSEIRETCLRETDGSYAPIDFYAVNKSLANEKMDSKIP